MEFDNGSLIVGHWNGARIRIHWTVFLSAFFFGRFQFLPIYWISFFIVVFIHEAGHVMVIRRLRLWVDEIVVHGFGGYCSWSGSPGDLSRSFIAWGGVTAQLLLLIITIGVSTLADLRYNALTRQIYSAFVISNIWMAGFNLLPIPPLDGAEAWKIIKLLRDDWNTHLKKRKRTKQDKILQKQLQEIMRQSIEK
jgi:stage IV sporulation protein FB